MYQNGEISYVDSVTIENFQQVAIVYATHSTYDKWELAVVAAKMKSIIVFNFPIPQGGECLEVVEYVTYNSVIQCRMFWTS